MPAKSRAQQRMMGMDLARAKEGRPTRTGMSESQLEDFASTPIKGLPERLTPKESYRAKMRRMSKKR